MMFSNKIHKISSGTNISLYANDINNLTIFVFNDAVYEKNINFDNYIRCKDLGKRYNYNMLFKLNNNHNCICFDKNISVINNE